MNSPGLLIKKIAKEVQYSVILTDLIMTVYVLWLILTNTSHWLPGILFGLTPYGTWLLLRANRLFHLCKIHRLMLIHSFIIYGCCVYQAYFGFGDFLYPARWVMFVSGLGLFIHLVIQLSFKRFRSSCEKCLIEN